MAGKPNDAVSSFMTTLSTDEMSEADSFVNVMEVEPSAALSLKVTPRHELIGMESSYSSTQVCATINACEMSLDDESRAPVDIVVALDVSGSMSGKKLELCKKTLQLLLRELRPQDSFGLVSFADEAAIEIPTRKLTKANKETALANIKKLHTRGCTNLSGAIGMAAQEIKAVENPNGVQSIFLLTDGLANRGISDKKGIIDLTKGCLQEKKTDDDIPSSPPIAIHTFGYGSDRDSTLLRDISLTNPGGTYYFVETDSNVASAFGDALGGVLSVVAQNTVITVSVPPEATNLGVKIIDVHHKSKIKKNDNSYRVTVGDFYAEESRDVLFEITLANGKFTADQPVLHANVSMVYTDTIQKKVVSSDTPVTVSIFRPTGNENSAVNTHVAFQWLRIRTTLALEKAEGTAERGNLSDARAIINDQLEEIRRVSSEIDASATDPLVVQLISDLNEVLHGLVDTKSYTMFGTMNMQTKQMSHAMQRCNESHEGSYNVYRSKKKALFSKSLKKG